MTSQIVVKRGMRVIFKPEWRDAGDDKYTFVVVSDVHPIDGSFHVSTVENTMWIRPQSSARLYMVESAEPLLPVVTFLFLGLNKKGAGVQMRRTLGDRDLSVTVELLSRSTFRQVFQRGAADCTIGQELRSAVEFPERSAISEAPHA